jgi:hypothetical protein
MSRFKTKYCLKCSAVYVIFFLCAALCFPGPQSSYDKFNMDCKNLWDTAKKLRDSWNIKRDLYKSQPEKQEPGKNDTNTSSRTDREPGDDTEEDDRASCDSTYVPAGPTQKEIDNEAFIEEKAEQQRQYNEKSEKINREQKQQLESMNVRNIQEEKEKKDLIKEAQKRVDAAAARILKERADAQQRENQRLQDQLAKHNDNYRIQTERMFKRVAIKHYFQKTFTKKQLKKRQKERESIVQKAITKIAQEVVSFARYYSYNLGGTGFIQLSDFILGVYTKYLLDMEKHRKRNIYNLEAKGVMMLVKDNVFIDENGCVWELRPPYENIFHDDQDGKNTVKFLRKRLAGGEYETIRILQQGENAYGFSFKGKNQGTGKGQQTFNFSSSQFPWLGHWFQDVIPHLLDDNYNQYVPLYGAPTTKEKFSVMKKVMGDDYSPADPSELDSDYDLFLKELKKRHKVS